MTEDEWADEGLLGERSDEDLAWTPTGPAGENPLKGKYRLDWEFEAAKGRFWVGRQLPLGRVVLIKVLGADARAESATEQLRLEAEACAGVTSPHTLALLDFDTTQNGIPFLVFEYVAGLSLAQALRISTRFELTRAVRVVAQVARGLGLLHRRGFIHGDIRLPNLLLLRSAESAQETIKILDFGRVQRIPPVSAEDRASPVQADPDDPPRDPRYLSPEQILRHPPSPSIDIYALGILLFELLSGRPPFGGGGATEDEIRHQQLHTIAPPLGTRVSELAGSDVEELVARCLAKRPEDRPASVLEMREALSDACGILIGGEGEPAGATTMIDDLWVEGPSREPVPPPAPHASLSEDLVLSVETTEGPIPESVYGDDIRFPESVYADEVPTLIQETPDWVTSDEEPTPNADDDVLEERLEGGTSRDGAEAERERTIDEILRAVEELTLQEDAKAAAATPPRSVSSPESPPSDPFGSPVAAASAEAERLPKASTSSAAAPLEDPPPVVEGPHPVIKGAPASDTVETFELPVLPPWSESSPTPPRTSRDPVTRPDGQYFRPRQINTPHVPPHADPSFDEPSPAPPVPPPTPLPQAGTPTPGLRSNAKRRRPPREPPKLNPLHRRSKSVSSSSHDPSIDTPPPLPARSIPSHIDDSQDDLTPETSLAAPRRRPAIPRYVTPPSAEPPAATTPLVSPQPAALAPKATPEPSESSPEKAPPFPPAFPVTRPVGPPPLIAAEPSIAKDLGQAEERQRSSPRAPGSPSVGDRRSSSARRGDAKSEAGHRGGGERPSPVRALGPRETTPGEGASSKAGLDAAEGRRPVRASSPSAARPGDGAPSKPLLGGAEGRPPSRASSPREVRPGEGAPPKAGPGEAEGRPARTPDLSPARSGDRPTITPAEPEASNTSPPAASSGRSSTAELAEALFRDATPMRRREEGINTGEIPIRPEEVFVSGATPNGIPVPDSARATGTPPALRLFREDRARIARLQEKDSTRNPPQAPPPADTAVALAPPEALAPLGSNSRSGAWALLVAGLIGMTVALWLFATSG